MPLALPAEPASPGAVPGLADTVLVLRARRVRRRLRHVARVCGGSALVGLTFAVVTSATSPQRLLPGCAVKADLARTQLSGSVDDGGWIDADNVQRDATERIARAGGGVRLAVTDVVRDESGLRYHVWTFVDGDEDGARGAFVATTGRRITTIVDPCTAR